MESIGKTRCVVAAVQATPAFLDLEATLTRTLELVGDAVRQGATIVVFPEAFLSGYPFWLWGADPSVEQEAFAALWDSAIDVPGPAVARLSEAASTHGVSIVIGVNERESHWGRATLYNTLLTFGPDGALAGHHRKLVPTYKERTIWGAGDGSSLTVPEVGGVRLSGLICWENFMPLARYAHYAQGAQLHIAATVDSSPSWGSLMRTIAAEGRIFVVGVCQFFARSQFPDHPLLAGFSPDADVLTSGGSIIVGPGGDVLAGPLEGKEGILTTEIDLAAIVRGKHSLDVTGHYARPDIFRLSVNSVRSEPVTIASDTVQ
jgi:nitrilase